MVESTSKDSLNGKMDNRKRTLRVAMVGHGFMGRAHSNAFGQVERFFDLPVRIERKVICGRDKETLTTMASQWGWEEIETDWRAVIERSDIDAVDVATPNHLHAPIAMAAAGAGKIVFCEKPLAMSLEQAEAMAAAASSVPNLVWFNYRRVPAVAFAKRLIAEGKLGRVYRYRGQYLKSSGLDPLRARTWRNRREEAGSGVVGDLLSHLVDTAMMLNGRISELTALTHTFAKDQDVDDAVNVIVRFENGSVGAFEASRFAAGHSNHNTFEINGSGGMLRFDLEDLNRLEYFDSTAPSDVRGTSSILVTGPDYPYTRNFWPRGHVIGYEHTFIATLADFLTSLAEGSPFHANFDDALEVQRVLDTVERSAKAHEWVAVKRKGQAAKDLGVAKKHRGEGV